MARRSEYLAQILDIAPADLVFLDEAGSHIAMTRAHAWAPEGERVHGRVPRNRGKVLTMIGALTLEGVTAMMTVEGGTSADVFKRFIAEHLVPTLRPGQVVVMDNLGAHHATGVRAMIEEAGARVLYLPPYSPDLNPIESCWSKVKNILRSLGARSIEALELAVKVAAQLVTPQDAESWFTHDLYLQVA